MLPNDMLDYKKLMEIQTQESEIGFYETKAKAKYEMNFRAKVVYFEGDDEMDEDVRIRGDIVGMPPY